MERIIDDFIERNTDEAVQTLKSLISIRSVGADPVKGPDGSEYPFGRGVEDAYESMLVRAKECGFDICDVDHYGGHIEWGSEGSSDEFVGILSHLDVVPEGSGWSHDPYGGEIADGYIWGRGTIDDKGPAVAVLYAMRSLKDAGYEPARKVRLILGLDEETDWIGMERYFEKMPKPAFGFTPDADFPVLNGEKGIMSFKLAAKLKRSSVKGLELRKMSAGSAVNMVPAAARAVVNDPDPKVYDRIREMAESYEMTTGYAIGIHKMGRSLEITAKGRSAHGSLPHLGVNAAGILIGFLGELNFVNEDLCGFFDFYNDCIGMTHDGSRLGIAAEDEQSGALTMNPGILEYDGQAVSVTVDVRYPVTMTSDQVYEKMIPYLDKYGLGVLKCEDRPPIWVDPESPMIRTFMECYRSATGDMENGPRVIGGGTYARTCDNVVAFGPEFPGDPDIVHQADERLSLERFSQLIKIYAEAIYRLTQPDFSF